MFTDTKNIANAKINLDVSNRYNCEKSRSRLRRALKPLLRLISKSPASVTPSTHPNNVNLNNSTNFKDVGEELSTSLGADYEDVTSKVKNQRLQSSEEVSTNATAVAATDSFTAHYSVAVISSASIEKSPMTICAACSHGRNCQHGALHSRCSSEVQQPVGVATTSRNFVIEDDVYEIPIDYLRTDYGTFVWENSHDKLDDGLLNAWYGHYFHHHPAEAAIYRSDY